MRFWRRLVGHGKNVNVLGSVAAGIEREVAQLGSAGYRPLWGRRPYGWVTAVGSASRHLVDRHRLVSINQYAARDTHAGVVMAAGVDVTIMPGTGKFDPEDQRWLDQVATLHAALGEEVRPVSRHGVPEPGVKGAVDTVILTLGSSGALTAAVACFRAWLTLAPQLRIAGEGEVIIARRGNQPLPEPAPDEPPIESSPAAESPRTWHAQRVRTAGVNTVLLVSNGSEKHTVEYRSRSDHRAVVLRDGQRVYHGPYLLDCKFDLGRNGTLARLKVTDDPDIQLWIDQTQVYTLRQAEPGSADFLEHRAAAIRAALLAAKTNGLEKSGERARLRVAPDIGFLDSRAVWARTGRSASVVSAGPVIGVVTIEGRDRAWFTDRALHIRSASGLFVVPYDELAATRVAVEDFSTLKLYSTREDGHREIPMRHPDRIVPVINAVKKAVRRQGKGLGDPPPIRFSGTRASHDIFVALACVGSWMAGITALLAIFVLAQGIRMDLDVDAWYRHTYPLVIGFALGGCMATPLLGGIAAVCRVKPSFGLSMFLVAVYTLIVSAFITWRPEAIQARETDVMPQVDWAIRLPGLPVIALGNSADIVALGPWPRVLGTLFVTAVAFLAVTIVPMVRRRRMCRPRLW